MMKTRLVSKNCTIDKVETKFMSFDVVVCTVELDQPVGNTADYSFSGIGSGIESFICKLDGVELEDCMCKITIL